MNLKNRVTNKINNKALSTYKETVQHKHATLSILMWLLAICIGLTMLIMLPTTNYKTNSMAIGTADAPYTIDSATDFTAFANKTGEFAGTWSSTNSNNYFLLTQNIILNNTSWSGISGFYGHFDGGGHTITFSQPIVMSTSGTTQCGLFSSINSGSISNLNVNWLGGVSKSDGWHAYFGGIVITATGSENNTIIIDNCCAYGNIDLNVGYEADIRIGGIVSSANQYVTIKNCSNYSTLAASNGNDAGFSIGGISGNGGIISNCYNYGTINANPAKDTGNSYVAGIVSTNSSIVSYCYNYANVYSSGFHVYVGGIAGSTCEINYCVNIGDITGESSYWPDVGGIIGSGGTVRYSYNLGSISSNSTRETCSGGIAGSGATIQNCFNAGEVSAQSSGIGFGTPYAGGISGSGGIISNSYNIGNITALYTFSQTYYSINGAAGGIMGNMSSTSNSIQNCFSALGTISATSPDFDEQETVGGIVGYVSNAGTVNNCIYDSSTLDTSDATIVEQGSPVDNLTSSIAGEANIAYFTSTWQSTWDIAVKENFERDDSGVSQSDAVWTIADGINNGYPIFTTSYEYYDISNVNLQGAGTENSPYIINNGTDLKEFAMGTNASGSNYWSASDSLVYAVLMDDIEYKDSWSPIGTDSTNAFYGVFNGNGHDITFTNNITLNSQYGGLFGYTNTGSVIQNLGVNWKTGLVVSNSSGGAYAGGIVGYADATISSCNTSGAVSSKGSARAYAGGIAGTGNGTSPITNCYNTASISASTIEGESSNPFAMLTATAGGIVGLYNSQQEINKCYNTGSINAKTQIGGIMGAYSAAGGIVGEEMEATVINCYNTGTLYSESSIADAGGIIGRAHGTIIKCYNLGHISSKNIGGTGMTGAYSGGIVGDSFATITNCFSVVESADAISATGSTTYVGGLVGSHDTGSTVSASYYDVTPTNSSNDVDSLQTNLAQLVKVQANYENGTLWSSADANAWDFADTWGISSMYNGGYPELRAFHQATITYVFDANNYSQTDEQIGSLWEVDSVDMTLKGSETFTQQGYAFTQWTDGVNYYDVGSSINIASDITLYPVWISTSTIFTITLNDSDTSVPAGTSAGNIFVYVLVNDAIVQTGMLRDEMSFTVTVAEGASASIIVTGSYMTNITLTGDDGTQVGNKFELNMSAITSNDAVTITYTVTAPSSGSNFNNSIVI